MSYLLTIRDVLAELDAVRAELDAVRAELALEKEMRHSAEDSAAQVWTERDEAYALAKRAGAETIRVTGRLDALAKAAKDARDHFDWRVPAGIPIALDNAIQAAEREVKS